jgi:LPXTG-motif cell wall-anchored protein
MSTTRSCAPLLVALAATLTLLLPSAAWASSHGGSWDEIHFILLFDDRTTYEGSSQGMEATVLGETVHVSCSDPLIGLELVRDGEPVTVTDFYVYRTRDGQPFQGGSCGNPDLTTIPVCPAGTDHEGEPFTELSDCDDEGAGGEGDEGDGGDDGDDGDEERCPFDGGIAVDDPACVAPEESTSEDDAEGEDDSQVLEETLRQDDEEEDAPAAPADEEAEVLGVTLQRVADEDALPATGASLLLLSLAGASALGTGGVLLRRRTSR